MPVEIPKCAETHILKMWGFSFYTKGKETISNNKRARQEHMMHGGSERREHQRFKWWTK